jgi:hypothetical protein
VQKAKVEAPILVTPWGIDQVPVNPVQLLNAALPIVVILSCKPNPVNPVHIKNACSPIEVTLSGRVKIPLRPEHPKKALLPIVVRMDERLSEVILSL